MNPSYETDRIERIDIDTYQSTVTTSEQLHPPHITLEISQEPVPPTCAPSAKEPAPSTDAESNECIICLEPANDSTGELINKKNEFNSCSCKTTYFHKLCWDEYKTKNGVVICPTCRSFSNSYLQHFAPFFESEQDRLRLDYLRRQGHRPIQPPNKCVHLFLLAWFLVSLSICSIALHQFFAVEIEERTMTFNYIAFVYISQLVLLVFEILDEYAILRYGNIQVLSTFFRQILNNTIRETISNAITLIRTAVFFSIFILFFTNALQPYYYLYVYSFIYVVYAFIIIGLLLGGSCMYLCCSTFRM